MRPTRWSIRTAAVVTTSATVMLLNLPAAHAAVPLLKIIDDPFTNSTSQHKATVEPDTFAYGSTIVAAAQVGRFYDGGGSGVGWSTSTNGGTSWTQGTLPGITTLTGGTYQRVSDASVAYDAKHNVWLISSIPITSSVTVPVVFASRSTNGGLTWGNPVTVASGSTSFDKNWTVCDNTATSPYYGNCYTEFDDNAAGDRLKMSTSSDGGLTWGPARNTGNSATGLGGQPLVQPNGTVIVPAVNASETSIISFRSINGGASWTSTTTVSSISTHAPAGSLRSGPLPTAEIDSTGKVYVAWQDCRFRTSCASNDIAYSTTTDGTTWTAVTRIPIDATTSGYDHFIPGLAVDPMTSGATTKLSLTYYFYRTAACGSSCQLEVGSIQSLNGGSTWSTPVNVAGPFSIALTPNTSQGRMVGDYISTSWIGGKAYGAFAVAQAPSGGMAFDQAIYVPASGLSRAAVNNVATSRGDRPVATTAAPHAAPATAPISRR